MLIEVDYDLCCNHSSRKNVEFGRWSQSYDFVVEGVSEVEDTKGYGEKYSVANSNTVWVLSMQYSEGDSFGRATGKGTVIFAFGKEDVAKMAYGALDNAVSGDKYSFSFKDDFDNIVTSSNPIAGYFERCESIDLTPFRVDGKKYRKTY